MGKRSYRQDCALARATDLLGERWTLLLLRDLLVAPRRFSELERSLKGIGPNLLAGRLKELEAAGVIEQRADRASGSRVYALTPRGAALEPAILALIRWGLVHLPARDDAAHHRHDWDLLALKSAFQSDRFHGAPLAVQFRAGDFEGWTLLAPGRISIGLGSTADADLTIDGTVRDLFVDRRPPAGLLADGSEAELARFMEAFALRP
ncbi:MAG: helix-turn-helix domain-containing protein [Woeseiaceae bacterium]|nr:helix-turn-helix domain-containing protein [Woeseiaceae bacterium]